jgi:hypothetical protein
VLPFLSGVRKSIGFSALYHRQSRFQFSCAVIDSFFGPFASTFALIKPLRFPNRDSRVDCGTGFARVKISVTNVSGSKDNSLFSVLGDHDHNCRFLAFQE